MWWKCHVPLIKQRMFLSIREVIDFMFMAPQSSLIKYAIGCGWSLNSSF